MNPDLARLARTNNAQRVNSTKNQVTFPYEKLLEKVPDHHDVILLPIQRGEQNRTQRENLTTTWGPHWASRDREGIQPPHQRKALRTVRLRATNDSIESMAPPF